MTRQLLKFLEINAKCIKAGTINRELSPESQKIPPVILPSGTRSRTAKKPDIPVFPEASRSHVVSMISSEPASEYVNYFYNQGPASVNIEAICQQPM